MMKKIKKIRINVADLPYCKAKNHRFNKRGQMFFCSMALLLFLMTTSCESPSLKANKAVANQPVENQISPFERDLQTMRTANFDFIYAFRRKDGGAFDGEDKKYLRANLPFNNRVVLTDEDKAIVIGSNYKFAPENLETLGKRFNIENHSSKREEKKEEAK